MTAVVIVEGLRRLFRNGSETVTALDGVSLQVMSGELTVAAGPSGSGKTTLLSILAGLESKDSGSVLLQPPLPATVSPAGTRWREIAFVPQSLVLLEELTMRQNVEMPALLNPDAPDRWEVDQLMTVLEIDGVADRYPSQTSGGEQQRAAIGRAMLLRPALLLADEPTGHQDRKRVELVMRVLADHAHRGNAVLISSHDETVRASADCVLQLADGRLDGPPVKRFAVPQSG